MRVLVVIFGGLDHEFLGKWGCPSLRQAEWGKVVVDDLWNQRDVATQITAQLITGKTWRDNGVNERKKVFLSYRSRAVQWLEESLLKHVRFGRGTRRELYRAFRKLRFNTREFVKADLACPSLFDRVENSLGVYVPAHNPEPSWALDRNIFDPRRFPDLGVEGALDMREKNYHWRKRKFMEALRGEPRQLLMGQFQYLDSTQHLYLSYHDPDRMDLVEEAYWRMNDFADEILREASGKYDRVLFISDNGAARKIDYKPTHHNRPFYSLSEPVGIRENNLRDFFGHILSWVAAEPNPGVVVD